MSTFYKVFTPGLPISTHKIHAPPGDLATGGLSRHYELLTTSGVEQTDAQLEGRNEATKRVNEKKQSSGTYSCQG